MKRWTACAVLAGALLALVGAVPATGNSSGTGLVISQVYGGGGNTGAQYQNDYIELFNPTLAAISVTGWSVQYASATGTGSFSSNVTTLSGSIGAGQYYLVKEGAGAGNGVVLPTADASGAIAMGAGAGKVIIANTTTGLTCNGGSTTCSAAQLAQIVDLVGYGNANFFEGAGAAPTLSNTTAGFRKNGGCVDTDINSADFDPAAPPAPRNSASPAHSCASVPTGVGAASPSHGLSGTATTLTVAVTPGAAPPSTGLAVTCDLTGISGSATQTFFDDGTNGDASGGDNTFTFATTATGTPGAKSLPCTVTDAQARSGSASIAYTIEGPLVAIHDIQGASHISPLVGQIRSALGIVTATSTNGFWYQDPSPDADTATSEGIFVFTSSAPTVSVGDSVRVSGTVQEFRPGGASSANLTSTELASPVIITVFSTGNPLPPATVVGTGGLVPPSTVIEDDATGDVETSGVFDPATDGLDFWESLEGMRVELDNPVAVGPTNAFGETEVVGDNGATASLRTARGGLIIQPNDFNPERVVLDDLLAPMPAMNVGDHYLGAVTGVLDYNFGNFFLHSTTVPPVVHDGVTPETTAAAGANELAVGTFNVENLAPGDPQAKFDRLAGLIVNNLRSPDLISVEEVQDDSGATDNGVVTAGVTLTKLVAAISAAGGPAYDWREIDPVNDADGGQPGGNIRQVFLFRTDRGLAFVDRPGATSTTANSVTGTGLATQLAYSPGRIDPTNTAWSTSRKPLAAELTFNGRHFFVIANHFNSKGGDDPLEGRFQPPTRISEVQRHQQAQIVHDFVAQILTADPNASVIVDGDLNDFEFSDTVTILKNGVLTDLVATLPPNERYSYVFEGNSQTLDHILMSSSLTAGAFAYDVVHVNSEFADQASDHDPSVVRIPVVAPETSIALAPANPDVGQWYVFAVKATVSATDHSGTGIAETRCVLDPPAAPASFADLPAAPCPYTGAGAYVLTEGVHTLYAGSRDNAGVTDLVSRTFTIDKTGPTSQISPLAQFQGAASFPVAWTGTDNLSGVHDFTVRYRQAASNGTFGSYTTWLSHTTANGATFTAPAGSTTCFSVRATDNAGWTTSTWSAERCTTVPLDDPALARIGFWSTVTGPGYYGPGISHSTWIGNQLSATMRGSTIGVLVTKQPGGGQIQLRWNGYTQATVSLSAASVQKQQLVTFTLPGVQTGTLSIVQTGYGTVDIDGAGASKTS